MMNLEVLQSEHDARFPHQTRAGAAEGLSTQQLDALRNGDGLCWERLLHRMEKRCLALAWRVLNDSHLAADAVQNGFLCAYRARASLRSNSQIEQWLLTIVANAAREAARVRQRTQAALQEIQEQRARATLPGSEGGDKEDALQGALSQLDEQSRLTFLLVHQEGFTYQEVAVAFGWPVGTVRSKLHRARMRLRELLQGRQEPTP
jgi:RNA polymerase sigma-70 factor, ECF subfamily